MSTMDHSKSSRFLDVINILLLILFLIVCIYPFYYVFIYSISDPRLAQGGVYLWPAGFSFEVYATVFQLADLPHAFLISVLRTVVGTIVTVFSCSMLAFLITQEDFRIRKIVYRFLVVTMYFNAGLIPWYITIRLIGLTDSFWVYILPTAVSAFYVILLKTFMEQLPKALEESAKMDGAGFFTIFSRIILPLSTPVLATIAVFAAVAQWNSWIDTYFFINSKSLYTAQYVLYTFIREADAIAEQIRTTNAMNGVSSSPVTPTSIKMGITMVVTIPVMFVYPYMQRYFVKGLNLGAVKG